MASSLHPSVLPTLCLLFALTNSPPPQPLDALIELALTCVYEDDRPTSFAAWTQRITAIEPVFQSKKTATDIQENMDLLLTGGLDAVHGWLNELKSLCPASEDDESPTSPTRLHRHSPSALYLRRTRLSFNKLSFDEAVYWWDSVTEWCKGQWKPPDNRTRKAKMAAMYRKAKKHADYQGQRDALSYFDIDEGITTQNKTQYALLCTAFLEYEAGGLNAAREALAEAVSVARRAGDARCLVACSSLAKRLDLAGLGVTAVVDNKEVPVFGASELHVSEGRPSPTDILWEIKRASALAAPIPPLIALLYASRTMYQNPSLNNVSKDKGRVTTWNDRAWEPAWHATASLLWYELGSATLSSLRERVSLDSCDAYDVPWHIRIPILARRATKLVRVHRFDDALQMLLRSVDSRVKRRAMGLVELRTWERCVWDVVEQRAQVLGATRIVNHIRRIAPPPARHWTIDGVQPDSEHESPETLHLEGVRILEEEMQPVQALPYFLKSLRLSTLAFFSTLRLLNTCYVATVRLLISPTRLEAARSLEELDAEWGALLAAGAVDPHVLALALETKGRALLVHAGVGVTGGEGETVDSVTDALACVQQAYEISSDLGDTKSAFRLVDFLGRQYDLLRASSTLNASSAEQWTLRRMAVTSERQRLKVAAREAADRANDGEWRLMEVEAIVAGVQKAVLATLAGVQ